MRYYFAPMEGITDYTMRRVHHSCFPGVDRYYTPFLSPVTKGSAITRKDMQEVLRENNEDVPLVPQLLSSNAEAFVRATKQLEWLGYREVNLNLGCPSGTVAAKGRGAGFLGHMEELERFLDEIFAGSALPISIKTRLGIEDPEEFHAILALYNRYPVAELTVHPRVQKAGYRGSPKLEYYREALEQSNATVCLSGGAGTLAGLNRIFAEGAYPSPAALMIGRGLIANPALIRQLQGGPAPTRQELEEYHGQLFEASATRLGSTRSTLFRMKELWGYMIAMFDDREKHHRMLKKATTLQEYQVAVLRIFRDLPLREDASELW